VKTLALAAALVATATSIAPADAMEYSYRVYQNRLVIDAQGDIEANEAVRLSDWFRHLPDRIQNLANKSGSAFIFNSPGGAILGGVELGVVIEHIGFNTGIAAGGRCASACVLAWAAGARKTATPDALIGVHSVSINGHAASNRPPILALA
jgi:hypothetical protein